MEKSTDTTAPLRSKRDTEMGRLRGQIKRERVHAKMAKRDAMDCAVRQAEAEAAQACAEANLAKLKAEHLRAAAEHEHKIDALTGRAERAEADRYALGSIIGRLRADCDAMIAGKATADDNPVIWVNGGQAYAKRVRGILGALESANGLEPAAEAFMAWIEASGWEHVTSATA